MKSANTAKAYAADWKHFGRWCRLNGTSPLPPSPAVIARYLTELTMTDPKADRLAVSTIERRLSGLCWNYAQRGSVLDRKAPEIIDALVEARRSHARPPARKAAIRADEILAMAATLPFDLRGLRDRAILLLGYAGGLRRSELVSLDIGRLDGHVNVGRVDILEGGAVVSLKSGAGWQEIEIGRGTSEQTCPVHALEQWLHFARIVDGPIFVRVSRDGSTALNARLNDRHVARLIKRTVLDAGLRQDLPEAERLALFSGHSLSRGLAASTDTNLRSEHKLPSGSPARREGADRQRFLINLTRAAGL